MTDESKSGKIELAADSGLAPIAKTEEMSDDLSEETLVNGGESEVINTSTPIRKGSWRLSNGSSNTKSSSENDPEPPWWSDEDDDERTDRNASSLVANGSDINHVNNGAKLQSNSVEDEFESFSCTDEEDEGDQTSLDSNSTSR